MNDVMRLLADPDEGEADWAWVCSWAEEKFSRPPSVESLLFLIGIQARDGNFAKRLKKEMKQDLIMEGTYVVLAGIGVYEERSIPPTGSLEGAPSDPHQQEGSPGTRWVRVQTVPVLSEADQERLLRIAIARYLKQSLTGV